MHRFRSAFEICQSVKLVIALAFVLAISTNRGGAQTGCIGDCNGDGQVTVDEIITGVAIILGDAPPTACSAFDPCSGGSIGLHVDCLLAAIDNLLNGCPGPTPTPPPTLTETIRYQLTAGSQIVSSPPPPMKELTILQPLSGTFTVVRAPTPGPNTLLRFSVTNIRFQSADFAIAGDNGYIDVSTIPIPLQAQMSATVSINGRSVGLNGSAPFDSSANPPTFHDLEVCGSEGGAFVSCEAIHAGSAGGYSLTLFAAPN